MLGDPLRNLIINDQKAKADDGVAFMFFRYSWHDLYNVGAALDDVVYPLTEDLVADRPYWSRFA